MLLIKTYVKESRLHGVGVFSSELVLKGTIVWRFCDGVDLIVAEKDAWGLWRECLDHYGWLEDGFYVFCNDNAKYINHSLEANLEKSNDTMIASRDIQPGEEITENYLEVYGELWGDFDINKAYG
jgi:uncharacterized protein